MWVTCWFISRCCWFNQEEFDLLIPLSGGHRASYLWYVVPLHLYNSSIQDSIKYSKNSHYVINLLSGSSEEYGDLVKHDFKFSNSELEVLVGVLRCISNVSLQLGRASSAIFYESPFNTPHMSSQEVVPQLLKILDTGFNSSIATLQRSELGTDSSWEKEVADHKRLRKFSANMFLSLHSLCSKAVTWGKVLNVIERYLEFLVPRKIVHKMRNDIVFNVKSSVTVQSTSQVAKVMFESALDVLLLLNYMVNINGQVSFILCGYYGFLTLNNYLHMFSIHARHKSELSRKQTAWIPRRSIRCSAIYIGIYILEIM